MRNPLFLILVCFSLTSGGHNVATGQAGDVTATGWRVLRRGRIACVEAETALYEVMSKPHFFIHLRVRNIADRPIAVDLRDYWRVIYPNQWGPLDAGQRKVIDERRVLPTALDRAKRKELIAAFQAGTLTTIPAGQTVDYFREFNASGRADVERQTRGHPFVFVSLDGEQIVTDGETVEQLACDWEDQAEGVVTELMLTAL
ncbi:hypothetical protein [Lignipirellula cremea]|uniref:Uncharacterized protein n=1 Tax=Lignipirellula cremea TaxID=2528010 RepID=A0A518DVC3_9BACT|nr:hypothetical protein [Lignipirellula cremea]QDU95786.1 hypothetical protein Pla8534_36030 [Lignipirellula cremea]